MNPDYSPPPELVRLVSDLFDRKLEEPSRQRLQQLLLDDDDACEWYVHAMEVHSFLNLDGQNEAIDLPALTTQVGDRSSSSLDGETVVNTDQKPRDLRNRGRRWRYSIGAVAATLTAVSAVVFPLRQPESPAPPRGLPVAMLAESIGGEFQYGIDGKSTPSPGVAMPQGTYRMTNGLIELRYKSGVELIVMAPAEFSLLDEMSVELIDGRATANVTEDGIGFTIHTAGCQAVDLGTSFAVNARKGFDSEVHVLEGEVRIDTPGGQSSDEDPMVLTSKGTQSAVKLYSQSTVPAIAGIDIDNRSFVLSLNDQENRYTKEVAKLSPVVYYRMNPSGNGTKLIDLSENKADAQIYQHHSNRPRWSGGKLGSAFELGGPTDLVYAISKDYPKATENQLSVVAWVYARSRPKYASIAKNWGHAQKGQFHFGLKGISGELEIEILDPEFPGHRSKSKRAFLVADDRAFPLHSWQFVAAVADGEILRLYRNSNEVASKPYGSLGFNPKVKALAIGTKLRDEGDMPYDTTWGMWDGAIDELAVFNQALSPDQINQLYELSKDGF